ncbi:MAG: sugar kinase [Chlorobiota bacterium]|nr:sugar kinase [Chlorobiota bacterium]QQS67442.1 MAG: sugar kinase [Chlorobiota bacterium]
MKKFDLISLGEVLVEFTNTNLKDFHFSVSGDVFNTLYYASRFGLNTGIITCFGKDLFTDKIISNLKSENIDYDLTSIINDKNNGIYFIDEDKINIRNFHYWRNSSAAKQTLTEINFDDIVEYISNSNYFLITGITLSIINDKLLLIELLSKIQGKTIIVFDSNYRKSLWNCNVDYLNVFNQIVKFIDIFLPSDSDLFEIYNISDLNQILPFLIDYHIDKIIIKEGAKGCCYLDQNKLIHLNKIETEVVDTTGSGDAFNAGLITGLIRGYTLEPALCLAQMTSVQALIVRGAINQNFHPMNSNL